MTSGLSKSVREGALCVRCGKRRVRRYVNRKAGVNYQPSRVCDVCEAELKFGPSA